MKLIYTVQVQRMHGWSRRMAADSETEAIEQAEAMTAGTRPDKVSVYSSDVMGSEEDKGQDTDNRQDG